jgi:hypothetical protein
LTRLKHIGKFAGLCLFIWLMYKQLSGGKGIDAIVQLYQSEQAGLQYVFLIACLLLMPVNWLLESQKWRVLHGAKVDIPVVDAFKTIMAGTAMAIVTPAGIGDVGGRMLASDASGRSRAFSATVVSSIAQNFCNLTAGLSLGWFFLETVFHITFSDYRWYAGFIMIQVFVLLYVYYNMARAGKWLHTFKGNSKWQLALAEVSRNVSLYSKNQLHKVLVLSMLRYAVYFLQYLLILFFLHVDMGIAEISGNIAGIYLIQSGIPLPPFAGVLARGELAILVWAQSGVEAVIALAATFSLWIINLMIPACVGLFVLLQAGKANLSENNNNAQ